MRIRAFVGLGANLDDPGMQVLRAFDELARLPQTSLLARSSLWRSAPVGFADQPEYVNAVAKLETDLGAEALLAGLQRIEFEHGRARSFANAPRTLDLDLLLYGDQVSATPDLVLPHPRMHERAFVLEPLLEVEPDVVIPGHGSARAGLASLQGQARERIV